MASLKYLPPFLFLALVPVGAGLGGGWTFLPAIVAPLALAGLDAALGEAPAGAEREPSMAHRLLPWIYIPLQLAVTGWVAGLAAAGRLSGLETAGLVLSVGLTAGVFGFVAAHEMIHSRAAGERALGLALLASVFYMHFAISHVQVHHRRAATPDDPATARLGESLYAFLPRSVAGQVREVWGIEARRLRRAGRPVVGPGNRIIVYAAIEALLVAILALISLRALAFVLASAAVAIVLVEAFNYVAHYGLTREPGADGRPGRLGPEHSWNSARRMNNAALFNMGRHSDHHRLSARPYQRLEMPPQAPQLPAGYAGAMLLALVPALWRSVMDPRAAKAAACARAPARPAGTFTASQ